jgi:hypothetical protein
MRTLRWILGAAVALSVLTILLVSARPSAAIPAWSRKYKVDCSDCHVAGFKLTKTGQNFLRAGHKMGSGAEDMNLSDYVSVAQKIRFTQSQTDRKDGLVTAQANTFEQHALSLYMGGPLDEHWSFFAEMYWHENSGATSGASDFNDFGRSKLADAYLQYIGRQNETAFFSARFGQFTPYLLHLHGAGARLSQDRPYVINSGYPLGGDNPYKPFSRQYGLELSQSVNNLTITGAVVNGTGGAQSNRVDNDLRKDFWGTADYSFDDFGSMLGVYGYMGHYPLHLDLPAAYRSGDDFNQVGLLGNLTRKQGALLGAYFQGKDEFTPIAQATKTSQKSQGYYIEGQLYTLHPRFAPYVRWDFWDVDKDVDKNEVQGPLLGVSWRAFDAGRLVAHIQQLKTRNDNSQLETKRNSFVVEANFMF